MHLAACVIIPTHNRADILQQCLPRLLAQTVSSDRYEIIIVDDGSTDDTEEVVKSLARPNVFYRRYTANRGAGAARNVAIAMSRGEILLFVDDDAFVRPDFIARHLAAHENTDAMIVTGPIVEISDIPGPDIAEAGRFEGWHSNPFATCNASVRRALVAESGGFDETFNVYGWEDSELHLRLAALGARGRYIRKAPIFHYKPASVRQNFVIQLKREQKRGAMGAVFCAKHPKFGVWLQTKQLTALYALDSLMDGMLDLSGIAERALKDGIVPSSAFLRLLVVNHVEIDSGRREWNRLGAERRAEMAKATIAMVNPPKFASR